MEATAWVQVAAIVDILDLGGRDIEVFRLGPGAADRIVNGTVRELNPMRGMLLHIR